MCEEDVIKTLKYNNNFNLTVISVIIKTNHNSILPQESIK
jgi:hypothetical protein